MKAFISPTFMAHLKEMVEVAQANGKSMILTNQRKWYVPPGFAGDPLSIEAIKNGYYKDDLSSAHIQTLRTAGQEDGGRISDAKSLKFQSDYLSAEERAFRFASATSIRCAIHTSVRDEAHAKGNGIYYGGILKYVQDSMASGYNGSTDVSAVDSSSNSQLLATSSVEAAAVPSATGTAVVVAS